MGKGQSKSYTLSTAPEKANHKRPKSSQQRESLLVSRNSSNINGNTQSPVEAIPDKGNNSSKPEEQKVTKSETLNQQIDQKEEREDNSSQPVVNGITETETELQNKQNSVSEVTENSEKEISKGDNLGDSNKSSEYNPQEESDQIDRALEEYIESQKTHDKVENKEVEVEDTTEVVKEEVKEVQEKSQEEASTATDKTEEIILPVVDKEDSDSEKELGGEESEKESEVVSVEVESKTEVTEEVSETTTEQRDNQETQIELGEDKQEAQIELGEESEEETVGDKTVEEAETVQIKTVISLESTPPDTDQDRTSREEVVVDPVTEPPSEPAVPIEEPTLPESATIVTSEVSLPVQSLNPPEVTEETEEEAIEMPMVEAEVCGVDDLKDGEMREVDVGEGKALLVKENGEFYAVGSKCTHYGAPLAKGAYCKGRVRCPWHGACFNVKTGDIEDFPGLDNIPKFEVTVANGKVKVKGDKALLTSSKSQKLMCKQSESNSESVLIIGGGVSSVMCAETLREEGFTGKVTIATQEKYLPYDRPKLSKAMDLTPGSNALRSAEFYTNSGIDVLTGKKATSVDTKCKTVSFEDGSSLNYTSLVVGTGGTPRQLPIPGANFDNVCLLRTPDDANKIAEQAKGKKVVIIGSSFIGMEVAAFLADKAESISVIDMIKVPFQLVLGEKVGLVLQKIVVNAWRMYCPCCYGEGHPTYFNVAKREGMEVAGYVVSIAKSVSVLVTGKAPFEKSFGHEIGTMIKKLHEDQGVKFHLESGIKEFVGSNNTATEAVLSDDTRLPCDLVVLGVGVVPATDFLKGSDISMTNRGFITVDKNMKTNVEGVYATGDIVEFPLFIADDQQANVQHWQMAHAHGKTAAEAILKKGDGIKSVPFFWTMMYKKSIRYTGYGFGYDDIIIHGDLNGHSFSAFYTKGDNVVAVATLGTDPMAAKVAEIFYNGQKILKSEIQDSMDAVIEKFAKL